MNVQNKVPNVCTVVREDLFWFYWMISIGVEVRVGCAGHCLQHWDTLLTCVTIVTTGSE
jgi:hypothetical protein